LCRRGLSARRNSGAIAATIARRSAGGSAGAMVGPNGSGRLCASSHSAAWRTMRIVVS
jgi:hypothetical protein